jgi:hypothetical protein
MNTIQIEDKILEYDPTTNKCKIGESIFDYPGDVWVDLNLIHRIGLDEVRREVRGIYSAAHDRTRRRPLK